jgi:hypothetical protein
VRAIGAGGGGARRPGEPLDRRHRVAGERPELAFHLGVGINRIDDVEVCAFSTLEDGLAAGHGPDPLPGSG